MTAYSIAQLLKYKGTHELDIVVIDNNSGDGSIEYLMPFKKDITIINYPKDVIQSHGCAFDYVLPYIQTDYFITMESDSFPESYGYFNYIENLINHGYDAGGSMLKLSGGTYLHGCGAFYRKSVYWEARFFCKTIPYSYFPNMSMKEGFACHTMIRKNILDDVLDAPEDYFELADGYKPYSKKLAEAKEAYYKPVCGVFHNGMGQRNESVHTYGLRTVESEAPTVLFTEQTPIIQRIGAEPSQFFSWWLHANNKKVYYIPTETKWVNGRVGQQQEYTLMECGWRHIWGVSAYKDVDPNDEVAKMKQALPIELYNSLPEYQKIKE